MFYQKAGVARRSSLGSEVVELSLSPAPSVSPLDRATYQLRRDQLKQLRAISLDFALDDYRFSQALMVRAALDAFLSLDLVEQLQLLEAQQSKELELGIARPGA